MTDEERRLTAPIATLLGVLIVPHVLIALLVNPVMLLFAGATQLLWVLPVFIYLLMQQYRRDAIRLIIGAGIVFMLNAAGCGMMLVSLSSSY